VAVDTVIGALVQAREARVTARVDSADPRGGGRGPGGGHGPHGHHGDASTED
jgi:hypothetical protein